MITAITGTLVHADAIPAYGRAVVSWPPFTVHGTSIAGGTHVIEIVDGVLAVSLYPCSGATPSGVYYTVRFELDSGAVYEEYWIVPDTPAASIEQVRVAFPTAPGLAINPSQLTGMGALPGMLLTWNGIAWVGGYVAVENITPNYIRVTAADTGSDFTVSGSPVVLGGEVILHLPSASPTARGLVTTGLQTFGGTKTFADDVGIDGDLEVDGNITGPTITDIYADIATLTATYVPATRQVIAGAGLSGGGALSADVTLTANVRTVFGRTGAVVSQTGDYAVAQVTNAVPDSRQVIAGAGLSGGGALTANVTLTAHVLSVFGRTGAIVAQGGDYTAAEVGAVPTTRQVIAGSGMSGGGALSADVTLTASVTSVFSRTGAVVMTAADVTGVGGVLNTRQILNGTGITGGGDLSADRTLSVVADTTVQQVRISKAGVLTGTRREVNLIAGTNMTLTVTDDSGNNRVNVTLDASGAAASQTPWVSNIDGGGYDLSNAGSGAFGTTTQSNCRLAVKAAADTGWDTIRVEGTSASSYMYLQHNHVSTMSTLGVWTGAATGPLTIVASAVTCSGTLTATNLIYSGANPSRGDWNIASNSATAPYYDAALELREAPGGGGAFGTSPRLSFHWASVVASQIGMDTAGTITILDAAGTGFQDIRLRSLYVMGGVNCAGDITAASFNSLTMAPDGSVAGAGQIVRTQSTVGYTWLSWINTVSGDNSTTAIGRVYASHDAFIRYYSLTNFANQVFANGYGSTLTVGALVTGGDVQATSMNVYNSSLAGFVTGPARGVNQYGALYFAPSDASLSLYHSGYGFAVQVKSDGIYLISMTTSAGTAGSGRLYNSGGALRIS